MAQLTESFWSGAAVIFKAVLDDIRVGPLEALIKHLVSHIGANLEYDFIHCAPQNWTNLGIHMLDRTLPVPGSNSDLDIYPVIPYSNIWTQKFALTRYIYYAPRCFHTSVVLSRSPEWWPDPNFGISVLVDLYHKITGRDIRSYSRFCSVMVLVVSDHTCMRIKRKPQSGRATYSRNAFVPTTLSPAFVAFRLLLESQYRFDDPSHIFIGFDLIDTLFLDVLAKHSRIVKPMTLLHACAKALDMEGMVSHMSDSCQFADVATWDGIPLEETKGYLCDLLDFARYELSPFEKYALGRSIVTEDKDTEDSYRYDAHPTVLDRLRVLNPGLLGDD